jgi:hypothetical protein
MSRLTRDISPGTYVVNPDTSLSVARDLRELLPHGGHTEAPPTLAFRAATSPRLPRGQPRRGARVEHDAPRSMYRSDQTGTYRPPRVRHESMGPAITGDFITRVIGRQPLRGPFRGPTSPQLPHARLGAARGDGRDVRTGPEDRRTARDARTTGHIEERSRNRFCSRSPLQSALRGTRIRGLEVARRKERRTAGVGEGRCPRCSSYR